MDSDFFVGLMLYHCLQRWQNIETTLHRHFVFDGITTDSSILKLLKLLDICILIIICRGDQRVQVGRVASDKEPLLTG